MADFLIPASERIQQYKAHMEVVGSVLEIGTGSGVIARYALDQGAKRVVAVDINPAAVAQAMKMAPGAEVFRSDLFSEISGEFDTIIFAAPWSEGVIKKPLDHALYDNGVVERFLMAAGNYLAPEGAIWLQYSDAFPNNFNRLDSWIKNGGFVTEKVWHYETWGALVSRKVRVILYKIVRENAELLPPTRAHCQPQKNF